MLITTVNDLLKLKDSLIFPMWDCDFKLLFRAKKILGIVDGSVPMSVGSDAKIEDIYVITHILMCETSNKMYKTLVVIFSRDTEQENCQILNEFYNFKFDSSKDSLSNFANLDNTHTQIESYQ